MATSKYAIKEKKVASVVANNGLELVSSDDGVVVMLSGDKLFGPVDAGLLVQAGLMVRNTNRDARFVCDNHGPFVSKVTSQAHTCPKCIKAETAIIAAAIETATQAEEEDA